jgi:hypothetical protein
MREILEKYSIARHRYIGKGKQLLIIRSNEVLTLVRYETDGVFYTKTFYTEELEPLAESDLFCN